jgi:hypothetical protein
MVVAVAARLYGATGACRSYHLAESVAKVPINRAHPLYSMRVGATGPAYSSSRIPGISVIAVRPWSRHANPFLGSPRLRSCRSGVPGREHAPSKPWSVWRLPSGRVS